MNDQELKEIAERDRKWLAASPFKLASRCNAGQAARDRNALLDVVETLSVRMADLEKIIARFHERDGLPGYDRAMVHGDLYESRNLGKRLESLRHNSRKIHLVAHLVADRECECACDCGSFGRQHDGCALCLPCEISAVLRQKGGE